MDAITLLNINLTIRRLEEYGYSQAQALSFLISEGYSKEYSNFVVAEAVSRLEG